MRTLQKPYYLVLEYMSNGNLRDFLQRSDPKNDPDFDVPVSTLLFMATCVADVMSYLESKRLIHRDLAARFASKVVASCSSSRSYVRNVLVGADRKTIKLADFGMACFSYINYRDPFISFTGKNAELF